jgi:hypothetical protein
VTDADRRAAEAIARKLREHGCVALCGDAPDCDVLALELVALLRGIGWRPTAARPLPAWHRPAGTGIPPTDGYLQARARLEEHLAGRDREAS